MTTTQTPNFTAQIGPDATITLRPARTNDQPALWRLAALDSAPAPKGQTLLAERGGDLIAAIGSDGRAIADPFEKTAAIISMLRAFTHTAAQLA